MTRIAVPLLALLLAAPLGAQQWQVAREQFAFAGTRLDIFIDVESPGTLRLIRGQPGSVRVAGRSAYGFTAAGLAEDDRLTLSAAGQGPVHYLVAVPENVWVDVRLPGRIMGQSVARGISETWEWHAAGPVTPAPVQRWYPGTGADEDRPDGLYTTFTRDLAPSDVSVPELGTVARVSVRIQGHRFRVITSRPLQVDVGSADQLVIRPAAPPMEVVLAVPEATRSFTLRLGGAIALVLDDTSVTTLCAPVTDQRLSDGRRWFTFTPGDGALDCGAERTQRHGG